MNPEIIQAEKRLEKARLNLATIITDIQSKCPHDNIFEGDIYRGYYTSPPFAVCKDCGLAEEGWGCGYKKLKGKSMQSIDRDEAMKFVKGGIIQQERDYD